MLGLYEQSEESEGDRPSRKKTRTVKDKVHLVLCHNTAYSVLMGIAVCASCACNDHSSPCITAALAYNYCPTCCVEVMLV